jgi:hypothetical protein
MDDNEVEYIMDAVEFVAISGHLFLEEYDFDVHTGAWIHKCDCVCLEGFSLDAALECCGPKVTALSSAERARRYAGFMHEAQQLAAKKQSVGGCDELTLEPGLEELRFFTVPEACVSSQS